MQPSPFIVEARPDNFSELVVQNSAKGLVLAYFWSRQAGPCTRLLPRLVGLCEEFGGRFLLALVDAEQHKGFARTLGVISIPTVRVYFRERLCETVHGAYSQALFRGVVKKYLADTTATEIVTGTNSYRSRLDQAKLLFQQGQTTTAAELLDKLPTAARTDPEIDLLTTHLDLIRTAHTAPDGDTLARGLEANPHNARLRYQLAATSLLADEYDQALEQLAAIADDVDEEMRQRARRGMLAVMAVLGPAHELNERYRDVVRSFTT